MFVQTYVYVGMSSMDELLKRIHEEVANNPPLGYEKDEAAAMMFRVSGDLR